MANPILKQTNPLNQPERRCSICKEFKTLDNFGKRSDVKSGLHSQCNACRSKYRKDHKSEIRDYERRCSQARKEGGVILARHYRFGSRKEIALYLTISKQWMRDLTFLAGRVAAEKRRPVSASEMLSLIIEEYLISKSEILPKLEAIVPGKIEGS